MTPFIVALTVCMALATGDVCRKVPVEYSGTGFSCPDVANRIAATYLEYYAEPGEYVLKANCIRRKEIQ